jgi:hypothetical protein
VLAIYQAATPRESGDAPKRGAGERERVRMGGRGDEDEIGNPPVPVQSPESIKALAKYAEKQKAAAAEAEAEAEAEDKFRNMRVGGGLDEVASDEEVRAADFFTWCTHAKPCRRLPLEATPRRRRGESGRNARRPMSFPRAAAFTPACS